MSKFDGKFIWYDMMTTDLAKSEAFYKAVFSWNMKAFDGGDPGKVYKVISVGEAGLGGLMMLPEQAQQMGARPGWIGYIAVDDVDATVARLQKAGGKVFKPAEDIPTIGRFAVVGDPHGAAFMLFKANMPEGALEAPAPDAIGFVGWRELYAGDRESDFAFYAELFGWTKGEAHDMGPMGIYQLFLTGNPLPTGGMMTRPAHIPAPFWLYYFNVEQIDAAVTRIKDNGGSIINGPMDVPGGSRVAQCMDSVGGMFAIVQPPAGGHP